MLPESISITDAERQHARATRRVARHRAGTRAHDVFAEVRREIGYLVRNSRPVKVVWHRHQGPAFLAHMLTSQGDTLGIPQVINGCTREALLEGMGVVLMKHGSNPVRAAIERHAQHIRALMHADNVHDCLAALRALQSQPSAEVQA
jgi:hypothetical protein